MRRLCPEVLPFISPNRHSQKFYVHLLIHYNGFPFRPHVTAFMFYELWVFHVIRQYFKLSNPIIEEAAI